MYVNTGRSVPLRPPITISFLILPHAQSTEPSAERFMAQGLCLLDENKWLCQIRLCNKYVAARSIQFCCHLVPSGPTIEGLSSSLFPCRMACTSCVGLLYEDWFSCLRCVHMGAVQHTCSSHPPHSVANTHIHVSGTGNQHNMHDWFQATILDCSV